jgi:transcriptional regulator with XRE-family HTH domain
MPLLLAERYMSLRTVARQSGVDNAFLSKMMRGQKSISVTALVDVSRALDLPDDFFPEVRRKRLVDWLESNPSAADELYDRLQVQPP